MYYLLNSSTGPRRWIQDYPYINRDVWWDSGKKMAHPIPDPLVIEMLPLIPDAEGEDIGPDMPEFFDGEIPLFSDALVAAMHSGGVDNLDLYNTVVIDPDNGKRYTNYKAVNIIGMVAAADMNASQAIVHPGGPVIDVEFDSLVIDEKKTAGALIFRLAESNRAILVHEKVKAHLEEAGFTRLAFLDPKDCAL